MKTQVIQLEPIDDVTSVRDKMSWAKARRVLLVFPPRARILTRTLDMRLLRRQAIKLGILLAIVTRSRDLRRIAVNEGIPVFTKTSRAQRSAWEVLPVTETPQRRGPRPNLRQMRSEAFPTEARWRALLGLRLLFFFLAILAVLSLSFLFVPSATIQLAPETSLQNLTVPVSADIDSLAVTQLVTGKSPEEAAHRLSNYYSLTTTPEIRINPPWWPWLPIIPFRINVSVGN